jgi:glycosyltransferase involved in cell wall biosynthesis
MAGNSTHDAPTLSVVINNHNYAQYLREAVDSAVAQLAPGDEVVVVDDGSTDESQAVLSSLRRVPQVRVIEQENQGQLAAVFNGLAAARGDVCLLLDSDDYFLAGYLARVRTLFQHHPAVDFIFSAPFVAGASAHAVDSIQRTVSAMALPEGETGLTRWGVWVAGEFVGTPTSGLALRRSLAERFLKVRHQLPDYFPLNRHIRKWLVSTDRHTATRISADGLLVRGSSICGARKYCCNEPGFYYRIHGSNAFATLGRVARIYLRMSRSRQVARLACAAFQLRSPPTVEEVLSEARQRSVPLRWRRRARLTVNYQWAVWLAEGGLWVKLRGQFAVLGRFFFSAQPASQAPDGSQE